jgi:antitoxin component YwqK of YwqJK toxin-antitoxin module
MSRKVFILLFTIGVISCTKEKKFEKRYENGNLKEVWYYEKDTLNGTKKRFRENGNLFEVLRYQNGQLNGEYSGYYENGFIARKGTLLDGNFIGPYFEYSEEEDGRPILEIYYVSVKGEEYAYYVRDFDSAGRVIEEKRVVSATLTSDETFNKVLRLEYLEDVEFDSIKIIMGKFSENFIPVTLTLDTLKTRESYLSIPINENYISNGYIRGIFHIYDGTFEGKSKRVNIKIRYFEEKLPLNGPSGSK